MALWPYSGLYPEPKRNEPVEAKPVNPLPENAMSMDTGDAGLDGFSVLSRASRYTGLRPTAGGPEPAPDFPRLTEEQ